LLDLELGTEEDQLRHKGGMALLIAVAVAVVLSAST
jgi:hypothetical protein